MQYRKVSYACNTVDYTAQKKRQQHSEGPEFIYSLIEMTHEDTKI